MMVKVSPIIYRKYITANIKNCLVMYVKPQKDLYGRLYSSFLLYYKLKKEQTQFEFEINPYNNYVEKKVINENQMTMNWHVRNLKVSYKDS